MYIFTEQQKDRRDIAPWIINGRCCSVTTQQGRLMQCSNSPAADVIEEERHRVQVVVQLCVVIEAAVPLQLHRLPQQGLQPPRGQHDGGRQVGCKGTQTTEEEGGVINLICAAHVWLQRLVFMHPGRRVNTSAAHFVVCPAVCCGRRCPCPPTLPWPSDPQRGCTSSTCGRRKCRS